MQQIKQYLTFVQHKNNTTNTKNANITLQKIKINIKLTNYLYKSKTVMTNNISNTQVVQQPLISSNESKKNAEKSVSNLCKHHAFRHS